MSIRKGVMAAVVVGVAYVAVVLIAQRSMVFPRRVVASGVGGPPPILAAERLWLETDQGRVEAWFLPGDGVSTARPGPLVIYAHGNAELIDGAARPLAPYRRLGVSVLLPEYRGYGRSAGHPSQAAILEDYTRFFALAIARPDVDGSRVVFHGRSLGGGVVCLLGARQAPAALVLQSTFTSVRALAADLFVPGFLVLDPFDAAAALPGIDAPVLLLHGQHDRIVPLDHARTLLSAARDGRLITYPCGHNDFPPDRARYWDDIEQFLVASGVL